MKKTSIPAYAVCGANVADRQAFFREFCRGSHPLWVACGAGLTAAPKPGILYLSEEISPADAGNRIAEALKQNIFDSLWLDWDDDLPVERLLTMMQTAELAVRCKLRKIVRCGDGVADTACMADGPIGAQLSQCDLFAVRQSERREVAGIRRRVAAFQPDIEVISWEDHREVAAVLDGRNVLQGVRFVFILVLTGAVMAVLNRLQFSIPDSMAIFLGTYLQALPFLLLGILLSAAIQVFVPAGLLQRIFPKNLFGGMLFGVLGGFMLPICDCASIPVFRSLIRKGVPLPAAVTFMIAAPIINPVVMLSTYYAFGANARVMLARMGFGILCSVLIGLCFAREKKSVLLDGAASPACACCGAPGHTHEHDHEHNHEHNHEHDHEHDHEHVDGTVLPKAGLLARAKPRLLELLVHFREEFFEVAKFLLIGIGVSTVLQLVMGGKLTGMSFTELIPAMLMMMAMAFLLSLCSSSDAVVGKNMGSSLPMGAVMSFMVFGPMIDVKNLILMGGSFSKRFVVKLLIVTFVVSFVTVYAAFSLGLGAWIG